MDVLRGDRAFGANDPMRLNPYVGSFEHGLVALNLWVDAWDVHPGNFVCDVTTGFIWQIDYGNAFGGFPIRDIHKNITGIDYRWQSLSPDAPVFPGPGAIPRDPLPIPFFMRMDQFDLHAATLTANEIAAIPDNIIDEIVSRAADVYGDPNLNKFAFVVKHALISRKGKVEQWMKERSTP